MRQSDQLVCADPCWVADTFWSRLAGLMGKSGLPKGAGLWIEPCSSVHTFFMRFTIDVVYLDRESKVVKIRRELRPWRMDLPALGAYATLELPAGGASRLNVGDVLCLS